MLVHQWFGQQVLFPCDHFPVFDQKSGGSLTKCHLDGMVCFLVQNFVVEVVLRAVQNGVAVVPHVPDDPLHFLVEGHLPAETGFLGVQRLVVSLLYALKLQGSASEKKVVPANVILGGKGLLD